MAVHDDAAAKMGVVGIEGQEGAAFFLRQQRFQHGKALLIERARKLAFVDPRDADRRGRRRGVQLKVHFALSFSSRARLRATPQR